MRQLATLDLRVPPFLLSPRFSSSSLSSSPPHCLGLLQPLPDHHHHHYHHRHSCEDDRSFSLSRSHSLYLSLSLSPVEIQLFGPSHSRHPYPRASFPCPLVCLPKLTRLSDTRHLYPPLSSSNPIRSSFLGLSSSRYLLSSSPVLSLTSTYHFYAQQCECTAVPIPVRSAPMVCRRSLPTYLPTYLPT